MSLSAILRALTQGFSNAADIAATDEAAPTDTAAPAKPRKGKTAAATESAPPAAQQPSTAATAPAPVQPAAPPAAPTLSKEKLNKAVLAVAGISREAAVEVLARFGATNTATLPADQYQAVFDAFEEKKAELDAAAARQPASLV
jgi:hypothetical protein